MEKMRGIRMVHLNVRNLFNKLDQIRHNFSGMDVIIISEKWLTPSIPDAALCVPGFNLIRQDRYHVSGKRGGGLCVYVNSKFNI